MADTPKSFDALQVSINKTALKLIVKLQIENLALQAYVMGSDQTKWDRLAQLRQKITDQMKPTLDGLDEAPPDKWLDFLRKFEGPPQ